MKKIIISLLLFPILVFSQTKTVEGTINDENGSPLPGATIQLEGSNTIGAITDFDGEFSINVPLDSSKVLVISYIGYIDEKVNVADSVSFTISMTPDTEALEEVVVVGYGTVLKRDLTGSVASIKLEGEVTQTATSVDQLMQGRASGVQVTQNPSNPNSGISVRIRGTNSLRGNNEPLYVIDGVIISSAGEDVVPTGDGNTGQDPQSGLNGINPRDIERIEVLKDASATAIYGSRGANGVVLITTKSGSSSDGKGKINVYSTRSFSQVTGKYNMLDGPGYAEYRNALRARSGNDPMYSIDGRQVYSYIPDPSTGDPTTTLDTVANLIFDWQEEMYNTGISNNFGATFSGGNDKGDYYVSAGFNNINGIISGSSFKTTDLRLNLNYNINEKLKVEARLSSFFSKSDFAEGGDLIGGDQSFVQQVMNYNPIIGNNASTVEDFYEDQARSNPYSWINDYTDQSTENRLIGSLALKYDFNIPGLQYEFRVGGNLRDKTRDRFFGLTTWQGKGANGRYERMKLNALTYQVNNFIRYNKNVNRNHRVNATLGMTYDVRDVESSVYAIEDFITASLGIAQPALGNTAKRPLFLRASDQQLFSILGRVNYTFKNKYVLTASFRRDGVSKFAEEDRYGFFPSFALAWRAGSENFVRNLDLFSNLKFRFGWGQIGNHGIGPYGTLSNYGASLNLYGDATNGTSVPLVLSNIANPNLTWETTEQLNFGIDYGFLNGKITGNIDVYDKTTKDLLQQSPIAPSTGFERMLINRGNMSNKGVELGLDVIAVETEDFNIAIGGNISFNKTNIESLGLPPGDVLLPNGNGGYQTVQRPSYLGNTFSRGNTVKGAANIFMEGEEVGMFYGWKTDGIFQTGDTMYNINGAMSSPGDIKVLDLNNDGEVTMADQTIIGNPNPDFVYGFNLSMSYKRLSLNALFNGVSGNDIANFNLYRVGWIQNASEYRNIMSDAWTQRWTTSNPSNTYPSIEYSSINLPSMMDRVIEDGSYLRLNSLTLNYDVNVDEVKFIDSCNVYLQGRNLYTWTDYSGYDPEVTSFLYDGLIIGHDWNNKPNSRTIIVGLNFNF